MAVSAENETPIAMAEMETGSGDSLFEDFDDEDVFQRYESEAGSPKCSNFVVEFGANSARVAQDLDEARLRSILDAGTAPRGEDCLIRWMYVNLLVDFQHILISPPLSYHLANIT